MTDLVDAKLINGIAALFVSCSPVASTGVDEGLWNICPLP